MDDTRIPIEELVSFPTLFVLKAVGHHTRSFSGDCLRAVRGALGDERRVELRTRLSSKAAYLSVSLKTEVHNPGELKAAYAALRAVEGVLTVL